MRHSAFTLIELLVVIAIIGLLSTVAVVATGSARDRAKTAKVNADLQQIYRQIEVARDENNSALYPITLPGSIPQADGCGDCPCRGVGDLSVLDDSHLCIVSMTHVFTSIGFPRLLRDPWGSPYLIDENEAYYGQCTKDIIFSAGPNKTDQIGTGDDVLFTVPFFQCL